MNQHFHCEYASWDLPRIQKSFYQPIFNKHLLCEDTILALWWVQLVHIEAKGNLWTQTMRLTFHIGIPFGGHHVLQISMSCPRKYDTTIVPLDQEHSIVSLFEHQMKDNLLLGTMMCGNIQLWMTESYPVWQDGRPTHQKEGSWHPRHSHSMSYAHW